MVIFEIDPKKKYVIAADMSTMDQCRLMRDLDMFLNSDSTFIVLRGDVKVCKVGGECDESGECHTKDAACDTEGCFKDPTPLVGDENDPLLTNIGLVMH